MPIPTFQFDDPNQGLPRPTGPYKACLFRSKLVNRMLATALTLSAFYGGRLLVAYEFNGASGYVGEIGTGLL